MILKYLLCILCNSYLILFYPFFNISDNRESMYIYICLIFVFSFLSYPINLIYLYNHDLVIKDMNEKNCNIVLNCSYNPIYEGEEKTENILRLNNIPRLTNIFEPRTDNIEMINETIIQMQQRVSRQRVIPHPPHPPPPPPTATHTTPTHSTTTTTTTPPPPPPPPATAPPPSPIQ